MGTFPATKLALLTKPSSIQSKCSCTVLESVVFISFALCFPPFGGPHLPKL